MCICMRANTRDAVEGPLMLLMDGNFSRFRLPGEVLRIILQCCGPAAATSAAVTCRAWAVAAAESCVASAWVQNDDGKLHTIAVSIALYSLSIPFSVRLSTLVSASLCYPLPSLWLSLPLFKLFFISSLCLSLSLPRSSLPLLLLSSSSSSLHHHDTSRNPNSNLNFAPLTAVCGVAGSPNDGQRQSRRVLLLPPSTGDASTLQGQSGYSAFNDRYKEETRDGKKMD